MITKSMSQEEWLRLGAWGRREEARKTWSYVLSDVTIYFCDFHSCQLERNGLGRIDWISKYQIGGAWLEYSGILRGKRPIKFSAIVEVNPRPPHGFQAKVADNFPSDGNPMLVNIAQFIKLPEGIIPIGCHSFVRLKIFDDGDSINDGKFTPHDMAAIHQIIMFRDGIGVGAMLDKKGIEFLEMFARPAYFRTQIIKATTNSEDHDGATVAKYAPVDTEKA